MCQCSMLNVCEELHPWNANHFMIIFKYVIARVYLSIIILLVIVYKDHQTSLWGSTVIIGIDSPHICNT